VKDHLDILDLVRVIGDLGGLIYDLERVTDDLDTGHPSLL
jgi:hypothetical protein